MSQSYNWEAVLSARDEGFAKTISGAKKAMGDFGNGTESTAKGINSDLDGMGSTAKRTGGIFKSVFNATLISGAVVKAIGAVTTAIKGMMGETMEASDAMDKFKSTMNFAGFTQKQTASAAKDMKIYADQTVFGLNDVMNTTAQLAANGITNYRDLTKAAGNLTAVAGGGADAFKSVAMMLTQTAGAGKLTTENWNQLSDAIPGASGKLQEALKKNKAFTGNFRDAMEKGQITAQEFNKAIMDLGLQDVAVEAAKSTKTFEGAIGNLQATAVNALNDIIDTIGKANITDFINGIGDAITAAVPVISGGLKAIGGFFQQFAGPIGVILMNFKGAFLSAFSNLDAGGLSQTMQALSGTVKTVIDSILGAVNGFVVQFNESLGVITGAFSKVFSFKNSEGTIKRLEDFAVSAFDAIAIAIAAVGDIIDSLPWEAVFTVIKGALDGILDVLTPIAKALGEAFKSDVFKAFVVAAVSAVAALKGFSIISGIVSSVGSMAKGFGTAVTVVKNLGGVFQALKTAMGFLSPGGWIIAGITAIVTGLTWFFTQTETGKKIWGDFVKFLSGLWDGLVKTATDVFGGIADFMVNTWNSVTKTVSDIWTGLQNTAKTIWTAISDFFNAIWEGIVGVATELWNTFGESLTSIWNGLVETATGVFELLKTVIMAPILIVIDIITGNWGQLKEDLGLIWQSIINAASSIWNGLVQYFSGILSFIGQYFSSVWNGIKSVVTTVWNAISSFLTGLWNGIVNGAKGIWNGLTSFFSGLWNGISSATTSAWNGIKDFVVGIAKGIVDGFMAVWNTLTGLVQGVIDAVKGVFDGLKDIDLFEIGKSIIDGFIKGMKWIWDEGKKFISGIGDWIRKHKGPISYDRRLLIPAGKAIMNGLHRGLTEQFGVVQTTVSNMAGAIANSAALVAESAAITVPAVDTRDFSRSVERINGRAQATATSDVTMNLDASTARTNALLDDLLNKSSAIYLDGSVLVGYTDDKMGENLSNDGRWLSV